MSEKIYCGNGKVKTFSDGGSICNISICLSKIPDEFITEGKDGKKYVNLIVGKNKEENKWGYTHYVSVNTWKPEKSNVEQVEQVFSGTVQPIDEILF